MHNGHVRRWATTSAGPGAGGAEDMGASLWRGGAEGSDIFDGGNGLVTLFSSCMEGLLRAAASDGNVKEVERLMPRCDINGKDENGWTALHLASYEGHVSVVAFLVTHGVSLDSQTKDGVTALHLACFGGHVSVVEFLVTHGVSLDSQTKDGVTALHLACSGGHVPVVEFLVTHGVSLDSQDEDGVTALHLACFGGHVPVVEFLVTHGVSLDSQTKNGLTALHLASYEGHVSVVEFLVTHGVSLDSQTKVGATALHLACSRGHVSVVEFLATHGVSLDSQDKNGWTALHLASYEGHVSVVEFLVTHGVSLDSQTKNGETALHLASLKGHVPVVEFLVTHGATLDSQDEDGATALHLACFGGHVPVVEFLVDHGATLDSQDKNGETALHTACFGGHVPVVEFLVTHGVSLDSQTKNGWTALHLASLKGHVSVVEFLVDHGASPAVRTNSGQTAFDMAQTDAIRRVLQHPRNTTTQTKTCVPGSTKIGTSSAGLPRFRFSASPVTSTPPTTGVSFQVFVDQDNQRYQSILGPMSFEEHRMKDYNQGRMGSLGGRLSCPDTAWTFHCGVSSRAQGPQTSTHRESLPSPSSPAHRFPLESPVTPSPSSSLPSAKEIAPTPPLVSTAAVPSSSPTHPASTPPACRMEEAGARVFSSLLPVSAVQAAQAHMDASQTALMTAQTRLQDADQQLQKTTSRLSVYQEEQDAVDQRIVEAERDRSACQRRLHALDAELSSLRAKASARVELEGIYEAQRSACSSFREAFARAECAAKEARHLLEEHEHRLSSWGDRLRPPLTPSCLDGSDVCIFLDAIGLSSYAPTFRSQGITGSLLLHLCDSDLENDFGMIRLVDRLRFFFHVRRLDVFGCIPAVSCLRHHPCVSDCPPASILSWDVERVVSWLGDHDLSMYAPCFRREGLTGEAVAMLDSHHLRDVLGVSQLSDRITLQGSIASLRESVFPSPVSCRAEDVDAAVERLHTEAASLKTCGTPISPDDDSPRVALSRLHVATVSLKKDVAPTIPHDFMCPITHHLMLDPVLCMDGRTYERAALEQWLRDHDTSPLTGETLSSKLILPNHTLRSVIQDFISTHNVDGEDEG